MISFARLCGDVEQSHCAANKIGAIERYLRDVPARDAAWAIHLFLGRRPKRCVSLVKLKEWGTAAAGLPSWLMDESNRASGDWTETISLALPDPESSSRLGLAVWMEDRILPLATEYEIQRRDELLSAWAELKGDERVILNRLVTGTFRVSVVREHVIKAISRASGISPTAVSHRLAGHWEPTAAFYERLIAPESVETDQSRPYPYTLGLPLAGVIQALGKREEWLAEWKWEGVRAQIIRRGGGVYIWSRTHELVNEQFPELAGMACLLPDGVVLDGMVLPWRLDQPLQSSELQRRLGRKAVTKKLREEVPITYIAFDLLEFGGRDLRARTLAERRSHLVNLVQGVDDEALRLSPSIETQTWESLHQEREMSRSMQVGGLILKRLNARYSGERRRGDWWKWKLEPLTIDAVLMYATKGTDPQGPAYSDYTFGVWGDDGVLVSIGKVSRSLPDLEHEELDGIIRSTTVERFGPVRTVKPTQVMQLAFERAIPSKRHKCGFVLSYPQIIRWNRNAAIESAARLEDIRLLNGKA